MNPTTSAMQIVLTTVPDRAHADRIAHALVDEHLAACVTVLAPATSTYRWQGALETAEELPLLIKTASTRQDALVLRLRALHPYDVPEIVVLPIAWAGPDYLAWVLEASAGRTAGAIDG